MHACSYDKLPPQLHYAVIFQQHDISDIHSNFVIIARLQVVSMTFCRSDNFNATTLSCPFKTFK